MVGILSEKVSPSIQFSLEKEFTSVEIKDALFQMHLGKSPGPDGMTTMFYQKYWHMVGSDITVEI